MFKTFKESALAALKEAEEALAQENEIEARVKARWALAICGAPTPFYEGAPDIAAARQILEAFHPCDKTVYPTVEVGKAVILEEDSPIAKLIVEMADGGARAVAEDGTTFCAFEL
jgi:hypothetical protein